MGDRGLYQPGWWVWACRVAAGVWGLAWWLGPFHVPEFGWGGWVFVISVFLFGSVGRWITHLFLFFGFGCCFVVFLSVFACVAVGGSVFGIPYVFLLIPPGLALRL